MTRFGSLFSGIGGVDLALERVGMRCAFQVEIDPECRRVLAKHWPDVPRYDDVRTVGRHNLPTVDVLGGGWPCQDLSVAGKRAGLAGHRSGLWWEFHRLIAELAPRWVLAENVPGLLSSWTPVDDPPSTVGESGRWEVEERNDHATVVASLVELGYGVAWRVLDAEFFGVPQRRHRVFLVGHRGTPWSAPATVLFESTSCDGDPAPSRTPGQDLAGTLGGGSGSRGWSPDTDRMTFVEATARGWVPSDGTTFLPAHEAKEAHTFTIAHAVGRNDHADDASKTTYLPTVSHALRSEGADASEDGTGRGTPILLSLRAIRNSDTSNEFGVNDPQDGERWEEADAVDTLSAHGTTSASDDELAVRRLTPLECERLQGFPDGWTEGQSDSTRYRQLGNAVAVPVIEWIARRLVAVDEALHLGELAG